MRFRNVLLASGIYLFSFLSFGPYTYAETGAVYTDVVPITCGKYIDATKVSAIWGKTIGHTTHSDTYGVLGEYYPKASCTIIFPPPNTTFFGKDIISISYTEHKTADESTIATYAVKNTIPHQETQVIEDSKKIGDRYLYLETKAESTEGSLLEIAAVKGRVDASVSFSNKDDREKVDETIKMLLDRTPEDGPSAKENPTASAHPLPEAASYGFSKMFSGAVFLAIIGFILWRRRMV